MKAKQLLWAISFLMLLGGTIQISAQQSEAERKRFEEFRAMADKGAAEAQYNLGLLYEKGSGVAKDTGEAAKWYLKAAEQGEPDAQFRLGLCYGAGEGVANDDAEALKWWRKAAGQGHAMAQFNLGQRYSYGVGVAKDPGEAVKWFRKAACHSGLVTRASLIREKLRPSFGIGYKGCPRLAPRGDLIREVCDFWVDFYRRLTVFNSQGYMVNTYLVAVNFAKDPNTLGFNPAIIHNNEVHGITYVGCEQCFFDE